MRSKPEEQAAVLRGFVADVDFDEVEAASKADYAARTEQNRIDREKRIEADAIQVEPDAPDEPIDVAELSASLAEAAEANNSIDQRAAAMQTARERVAEMDDAITHYDGEIAALKAPDR